MHHLPFKMHWEKIRANIHMPRSVQYPSLCFFFFSPHSFFLLFVPLISSTSQLQCKKMEACKSLSDSLSLSRSLPLSLSQSYTLGGRWRGGGLSFFLLLIVSWYGGRQCIIHSCASSPRVSHWPHRTLRGLSAVVPPCRSAALRGTWGSSARCAPVQVSCAAAAPAAESGAGDA